MSEQAARLKIGLVGCGGRGLGAAQDAMQGDSNCKLTALGDTFADKVENGIKQLSRNREKFAVDKDRFVGFNAYKQVIDSGVDVVILATPPAFRPAQLRYAIEKGKHVFCEKPVAVDGPGVRYVLETVKLAEEKKLSLVSGLCWRYHAGVREFLRVQFEGEQGQIRRHARVVRIVVGGTVDHVQVEPNRVLELHERAIVEEAR